MKSHQPRGGFQSIGQVLRRVASRLAAQRDKKGQARGVERGEAKVSGRRPAVGDRPSPGARTARGGEGGGTILELELVPPARRMTAPQASGTTLPSEDNRQTRER